MRRHAQRTVDWKWKYEWTDDAGAKRRVGSKYRKIDLASSHFSATEWLSSLSEGRIQPEAGDPFADLIQIPEAFEPTAEDLADFRAQATYREVSIESAFWVIGRDRGASRPEMINHFFPQHLDSCEYRACHFRPVCKQRLSPEDALEFGLFRKRTPHHQLELNTLIQEGAIAQ